MRKPSRLFLARPLALITLLTLSLTAFALSGPVASFLGAFEGIDVRLNWELPSETGLQRFELARRGINDAMYMNLATIQPAGTGQYTYLDHNLNRSASGVTSAGAYVYRLTAVTTGGEFNYAVTMAQAPSAVQRSWGSIKSMFR